MSPCKWRQRSSNSGGSSATGVMEKGEWEGRKSYRTFSGVSPQELWFQDGKVVDGDFWFSKKIIYTDIQAHTRWETDTQLHHTVSEVNSYSSPTFWGQKRDIINKQPPPHRDLYKLLVKSSQYTDIIAFLQIKSTHFSLACSAVLVTRVFLLLTSSLPLPCISQKCYFAQSSFEKQGAFHSKKVHSCCCILFTHRLYIKDGHNYHKVSFLPCRFFSSHKWPLFAQRAVC